MKKPRRVPVELQKTRPAGRILALRFLRQGHIRAPRQKRHGVREREIFDLHAEVDDPAALAAAEAVVDLLVGRDGEGGRFLAVERAEAEEVRPALLRQPDVLAYHVHNVVALGQLVEKPFGKCHTSASFHVSRGAYFTLHAIGIKISPY